MALYDAGVLTIMASLGMELIQVKMRQFR